MASSRPLRISELNWDAQSWGACFLWRSWGREVSLLTPQMTGGETRCGSLRSGFPPAPPPKPLLFSGKQPTSPASLAEDWPLSASRANGLRRLWLP